MAGSRRSSSSINNNSPDAANNHNNGDVPLTDGRFHAPGTLLPPTSADSPPINAGTANANDGLPAALNKPTVDAQGRALNPRSCVTCRKRKVKCDKIHPCTNCNRARIECIYPAPGRAPRKVRKIGDGRDKELLERLRRLEGVVKNLGVEVPDGDEDQDVEKDAAETVKASVDTGRRTVSGDAALCKDTAVVPQGDLKRRWTASHTDGPVLSLSLGGLMSRPRVAWSRDSVGWW